MPKLKGSKNLLLQFLSRNKTFSLFLRRFFTILKMGQAGFLLRLREGDKYHWLFKSKSLKLLVNKEYYSIAREIFCKRIYGDINNVIDKNKKYIVIDIGANRAYSTLFFAQYGWCEKVFAFELVRETYEYGIKNIELNRALGAKIHMKNFGLGGEDKIIKTYFLPHRDGISTTNLKFLEQYAPEELEGRTQIHNVECEVRKASLVFQAIVDDYGVSDNVIIKIDCEGAEYEILLDIANNFPDFFKRVKIIIGDAHFGLKELNDILFPFGFILSEKYITTGAVCPFLYFKETTM